MQIILFGSLEIVFQSIFTIILFLMLLPLFLQFGLQMLINAINSIFKTNIRPLLNVLLFPGAILRLTFMYMLLNLRGWRMRVAFSHNVGPVVPTNVEKYRRGFSIVMLPPKTTSIYDVIIFGLGGYLAWAVSIIWALNYLPILIFIAYNFGPTHATSIYFGLLFSFLVGGMPIAEETLLPLYFFLSNYPHLAVMSIMGFFGSILISASYGPVYGRFYFSLLLLISLVKVWVNQHKREAVKIPEEPTEVVLI